MKYLKNIALVLTFAALLFGFEQCRQAVSDDKQGATEATDSSAAIRLTTIEFQESEHDFGDIVAGEVVVHTYAYTNTGSADLIIRNIRTTCGCTVPQWSKEPLKPGESASVTVEFNSRNKHDYQNKKVYIYANIPGDETYVSFTAMVNNPDVSTDDESK